MSRRFSARPTWVLSALISAGLGFGPRIAVGHCSPLQNEGSFSEASALHNWRGEATEASKLLAAQEASRQVAEQQLEAQVKNIVRLASASRDPSTTKASLKALQDRIRRASELDAATRTRLDSWVGSAIENAARAEQSLKDHQASREGIQSSQAATKRLIAETERRNATVQQLVERFNSLLDQQLFVSANNEIAPQITAIDRNSTIDVVTNIKSSMSANEHLIKDSVNKRSRAFVDALSLNEQQLTPFVDEPPMSYPAGDVWQALSARRLERYGSIDLSGGKESERKIYRALNERGEINFNGTPLSGVVKYFKEFYSIPIVIDDKALDAEGVTPDEPITLELPAVSFRSALKLILEPLQLTYVIEDEVLRITSKRTSANVVRVYPVGDLVVPIAQPMGGAGGGGVGGGMGNGMGGGQPGVGGGFGQGAGFDLGAGRNGGARGAGARGQLRGKPF